MPKDTQSLSQCINSDFGENMYFIDNIVLFCKYCELIPKDNLVLTRQIKIEKHCCDIECQLNQKKKKLPKIINKSKVKKIVFQYGAMYQLIYPWTNYWMQNLVIFYSYILKKMFPLN